MFESSLQTTLSPGSVSAMSMNGEVITPQDGQQILVTVQTNEAEGTPLCLADTSFSTLGGLP